MTAESSSVRVAFVAEASRLAACAPETVTGDIEPVLVEWREDVDPASALTGLAEVSPDVVVAFRPELVAPVALAGIEAVTIGYLTEALPSEQPGCVDPWSFDRFIAASPDIAAGAELAGLPVWRLLSLPVADRFYRPAGPRGDPPRVLEIHTGLGTEQLAARLEGFDVAVNLEQDDLPSFEHLLLVCIAGGLLVLSAPLGSTAGLEPDIDYVVIEEDRADETLEALMREPNAFRRQWLGGRMKAERWRASSAWSRLVFDLGRDIAAFGRGN